MSFVPPSAEENAVVERLKQRLKTDAPHITHPFSDTSILRFYRGRKNVEENAFKALIRHVEWREKNGVDAIATRLKSFEKELNSNKIVVHGFDKEGRPIVFIKAAKHNKNDRDIEELRLLIIYTLEMVLQRSKPTEERITISFDLTGFTFACMDYDVVKMLVEILQYNYPDTLAVAYIVNAPFMFYACWAVIRPWLDPVTAAKVVFVNKVQLSQYFPPEALEEHSSAEAADQLLLKKSHRCTTAGSSSSSATVGEEEDGVTASTEESSISIST